MRFWEHARRGAWSSPLRLLRDPCHNSIDGLALRVFDRTSSVKRTLDACTRQGPSLGHN